MHNQPNSSMWMACVMAIVTSDIPDFSNRQMAVLLSVVFQTSPFTVRGLAAHLNVTRPVISRAITALGGHGLVQRRPDPADGRSVIIIVTDNGIAFMKRFNDLLAHSTGTQNDSA